MSVLVQQMAAVGLWPVFEQAVGNVARLLHDQDHHLDYVYSRRSTAHWRLSRDYWVELCVGINVLEQDGVTGDPCVGPAMARRRSTSPAPNRITNEVREIVIRRRRPSLVALSLRLEVYADRLAEACDRGDPYIDFPPAVDVVGDASHQSILIR